jgi:serine/threonine protein phosphatase 1
VALPKRLSTLWRAATAPRSPRRRTSAALDPVRLVYPTEPPLVYAVGDVHGRLDLLTQLEAAIAKDCAARQQPALLVLLGDLVDRGPSSAQVIDHVLARAPEAIERICLMGNHEALMLGFFADPRPDAMWLSQGGRETLLSYGVPSAMLERPTRNSLAQALRAYVPEEHLEFLRGMPVLLQTPTHIYVHAGIDSAVSIAEQSTDTLLWYRDDFAETYERLGHRVVHGHSYTSQPLVTDHRIAVDTGAYHTGTLSAVALSPGAPPRILSVPPAPGALDD